MHLKSLHFTGSEWVLFVTKTQLPILISTPALYNTKPAPACHQLLQTPKPIEVREESTEKKKRQPTSSQSSYVECIREVPIHIHSSIPEDFTIWSEDDTMAVTTCHVLDFKPIQCSYWMWYKQINQVTMSQSSKVSPEPKIGYKIYIFRRCNQLISSWCERNHISLQNHINTYMFHLFLCKTENKRVEPSPSHPNP